MTRLTRAEAQARTQEQLVTAAAEVFAAMGFHAASVDAVAERAGYSKGAVYSNFGSKEELFLAVLSSRMQSQLDMVGHLTTGAASASPEELLGLVPSLDWVDEQWCLLVFEFWLHALRNPAIRPRLAELYREFRARLAPVLEQYTPPGLRSDEFAGAAIALYQGLALQRHCDADAIGPDVVAHLLAAIAGELNPNRPSHTDSGRA